MLKNLCRKGQRLTHIFILISAQENMILGVSFNTFKNQIWLKIDQNLVILVIALI